jgi:hypothetical protein
MSLRRINLNIIFGILTGTIAALILYVDKSAWGDGKIWFWWNTISTIVLFYRAFHKAEDKRIDVNRDYSHMIEEVSSIGIKIQDLAKFLESEQTKIANIQKKHIIS